MLGSEQNIFETQFEIIGNFDSVGAFKPGLKSSLAVSKSAL
jgi:hypothetical protein